MKEELRSMEAGGTEAIVIGSGLGGLTTAAYLQTNGVQTLVLEQYDVVGGCSHVFRRKRKFEFDVGLHYLGDCQEGGGIPTILRGLGLENKVEFLEMDPDGFDTLVFPDFRFRVPRGWDRYLERLIEACPAEERGLRRCVEVLRRIGVEMESLPGSEREETMRWGLRPLAELLDHGGVGPKARAIIAAQSADYGAPPSRAPVAVHAGLLHHYLRAGAYYPRGGGQVLAAHLVDVIRSHGGEVRTRARVDRILVNGGTVEGVRLRDGEELSSRLVVSNADLKRTFLELIEPAQLRPETLERLSAYRMALPLFSVYLGLDVDMAERMPNTNYWIHPSLDPEAPYRHCYRGEMPPDPLAYVCAASVKDPESEHIAPPGHASMEIMSLMPPHYRFWGIDRGPAAGERYRKRDRYRTTKERIVDALIERAKPVVPELGDHIVWKEGATPITQERYTLATGGSPYGLEVATDQIGPLRPRARTEIGGLYLTGASTGFGPGVAAVMQAGVGTAGAILGRKLGREIRDGEIFGDPLRLSAGGPGWDALAASRRLAKKPASAAV